MGIVNTYIAVEQADLARLEADDRLEADERSLGELLLRECWDLEEEQTDRIDLDKAWDGLWYLLSEERRQTDDLYEPFDILGQAVDGANEIDLDGFDLRYLDADEVHEIAQLLLAINEDDLAAHFDPQAMARADVYPGSWDLLGLDYILAAFRKLSSFYQQASQRNQAILVWRG